MTRGTSLVFTTLALTACAGPAETEAPPQAAAWSFDAGQVVLSAKRGDNADIVRVATGDGSVTTVVDHGAADNFPRTSPDGTRLAYQSRPAGGKIEIYVRNIDGGEPVNVSNHPDHDVLPAWSPDGTQLAFMSTRGFELGGAVPFPGHLYLVAPDGTGLRQITREPLESSLGPQDWLPDGRSLLLSRTVDGQLDVFRLDVATGEEARITTDPADEYGCAVSPDGARIACHADVEDGSHLVVMNVDGSERREVTSGPGRRYGPRWSPDGAWLVYAAEGEGGGHQYDIRAVNLEDGRDVAVLASPEDEREPDWIR